MRAVYEEIAFRCERVKQRSKTNMQKLKEELFKTFDEQGSAESLEKFATRCDRVRALFVGGDPIDDLEDSAALSEATTALYVELKEDRRKVWEVELALNYLVQFARHTALARHARLAGRIGSAVRYETTAEVYYTRLPREWRW